jgi:hypothetical protein
MSSHASDPFSLCRRALSVFALRPTVRGRSGDAPSAPLSAAPRTDTPHPHTHPPPSPRSLSAQSSARSAHLSASTNLTVGSFFSGAQSQSGSKGLYEARRGGGGSRRGRTIPFFPPCSSVHRSPPGRVCWLFRRPGQDSTERRAPAGLRDGEARAKRRGAHATCLLCAPAPVLWSHCRLRCLLAVDSARRPPERASRWRMTAQFRLLALTEGDY